MFLLLILVILHLVLRKWRLRVNRRVLGPPLIAICVAVSSLLSSLLCCVVVTSDTSHSTTGWFLLRCASDALILGGFRLTWCKLIVMLRNLLLGCYSVITCIRSCCLRTTWDLLASRIIIGCWSTLVLFFHWTVMLWRVLSLSPRRLRGGPLVLEDLLILSRSWVLRRLERRVLMVFIYAQSWLCLSRLRTIYIVWETLSNLLCGRLPLVAQSWECRLLAFDLVVVGWWESIIINRSAPPARRFTLKEVVAPGAHFISLIVLIGNKSLQIVNCVVAEIVYIARRCSTRRFSSLDGRLTSLFK